MQRQVSSVGEDGKVVYKIEGDNSQALKALDEFEKEAKKTGGQFEGTVKDTMDGAKKSVSGTAAKSPRPSAPPLLPNRSSLSARPPSVWRPT